MQSDEHGGPGAARRPASDAEVVDALVALGLDEDDARRAVDEDRVTLVLVRQLLGEERAYTLEEVAEKGGLDPDVLRRIFLALGLPLEERYGESDVEEAANLARLLETFPVDALVRLARVRGVTVSRIAMGDANAVRDALIAPLREEGADDLTVAVRLAEIAESLVPMSTRLLTHAYRRALLHILSGEVATAAAREATQDMHLAVGFVDLVGYTALSSRIDPVGLDEVLDHFEQRALDVAGGGEDVDLVKFLGDAVMLVATDPVVLADTLLDLVVPVPELDETPLRAGLAAGPTLAREGDYFGPAVNFAARLTDRAAAWSLLADDHLTEDLEERFDVSRVRPMRIRGVGLRRPVAVSRRGD